MGPPRPVPRRLGRHDLLVLGLPLLSPVEEQRAWRRARAIMHWVGVSWPEWADERVSVEVEVVPGLVVPSPLHYSADATIRAWQLARQSAAAIALHEAGKTVTRRSVQSWLRRRRLRAPSSRRWRRWVADYGGLGFAQLRATLTKLRDELAALGERGGGRFREWAASASRAAEHVLVAAVRLLPTRRRRRRSKSRRSAIRSAGPIRAP
ncbi:MAG TPA: hypothetical protein VKW77_00955 [Acidimicrobiales bacterium]|nr:hypothetical protein [Acidimicrobiales bacterium]